MAGKRTERPLRSMLAELERLGSLSRSEPEVACYFGELAVGKAQSLQSAIDGITRLVEGRAATGGGELVRISSGAIVKAKAVERNSNVLPLWTLPVSELYADGSCPVHLFSIWKEGGAYRTLYYEYHMSYRGMLRNREDMAFLHRYGVTLEAMDEVLLSKHIRR